MTPSPFPPAPQGPDLPSLLNSMPMQGAQAPPEANPVLSLLQTLQQEPQPADAGQIPALTDPISKTEVGKHLQDAMQKQEALYQQFQAKLAQMQDPANSPQAQAQVAAKTYQDNLEKHRADVIDAQLKKYGTAGSFLINLLRAPGQPTLQGAAKASADQDYKNAMDTAQKQIADQHQQNQDQLKALQDASAGVNPVAIAYQKMQDELAQREETLKKFDLSTPEGRAAAQLIVSGQLRTDPSLAYHLLTPEATSDQIKQQYGVDLEKGIYRVSMLAGQRVFTPTVGKTSTSWVQTKNGLQEVKTNELGMPTGTVQGAVNIPSLPKTTNAETVQTVEGPNGPQKQVFNVSRTTTPQLPAALGGASPAGAPGPNNANPQGAPGATPAPPAAPAPNGNRVLGAVPLSPQAREKMQEQLGSVQNTRDLIDTVVKGLPLLKDPATAAKIQFVTDPGTGMLKPAKTLLGRFLPMSEEENKLSAAVTSLSEHINTLRGPLGATGFRGFEAFDKLMQQGGNLLKDPALTEQILKNTARSLDTLIKAKHDGLGGGSNAPGGLAPGGTFQGEKILNIKKL